MGGTIKTSLVSTSSEWLDRARGWETWRKGGIYGGSNETIRVEDSNVNYLERLELMRGSGTTASDSAQMKEVEAKIAKDHHSTPSTVITKEEEEEQAVLDAVVEEAKKVLVEEQVLPSEVAAAKESIQKIVKPKNADKVETVKPKKDPSRYKRLLPLKAPSRRYLYGANFIPSAADHPSSTVDGVAAVEVEVEDPEYTNKKVKVPSKKTLGRLFKENKKVYEEEEESWRNFEWEAPEVDQSLKKFIEKISCRCTTNSATNYCCGN
jgi:hypothetical protein